MASDGFGQPVSAIGFGSALDSSFVTQNPPKFILLTTAEITQDSFITGFEFYMESAGYLTLNVIDLYDTYSSMYYFIIFIFIFCS